jgi:hypothetical protein
VCWPASATEIAITDGGAKRQSLGGEPFVASRAANEGERAFKLAEAVAEDIESFYHLISSMSCSNCCWTRSSDKFLRLR